MIHLIDSDESVQLFCRTFAEDIEKSSVDEKFITVDTEFIRENLEYPLLCLVQIATFENVFIIDPLVIDISFLNEFFSNERIPKIFHSAVQDIEILHNSNIFLKNIYDTQSYEMLLSTKEQVSYQSIVFKYLGKKLNKDYSLSDWRKRPLNKKQIKYSVGDVTFLREIYKKQKKKLEDLNRIDWLIPEMKILEQNYANIDNNIKIFHQLCEWIENRAKEKNIDAKSIADEHAIKRVCKKGKPYVNKMLKYRGLINDNFKDFLMFAKEILPDDVFPDYTKQTPIVGALKLILEICSVKNNVASIIIANTNELEKLAHNFRKAYDIDIRCLYGWRKEIFGKYALDFLNKKNTLAFDDDQLEFIKR